MPLNLLTHLSRLGAVGIGILLSWQLSKTMPETLHILTKVEANQATLFAEHENMKEEIRQQNATQGYLLRGICMGMHKTTLAQQQFCNPPPQ